MATQKTTTELKKEWADRFKKRLVGRTISDVFYMDDDSVTQNMWNSAPIVIRLDDGTMFYPSRDDEGNDAGALFFSGKDIEPIAPVI